MTFPRQLCGCRSTIVMIMAYGCITGMLQAATAAAVPPAALVGTWRGIYWPDPQQSEWIKCVLLTISADGAIYQAVYDYCASNPSGATWTSCSEKLEDCSAYAEYFSQIQDVSTVDTAAHGGQRATYYRVVFQYTIGSVSDGAYDCALAYADDTQMLWFGSHWATPGHPLVDGADTQADAIDSCPVLSSSSSGKTTVMHADTVANMTRETSTPVTDNSWTDSDRDFSSDTPAYPGLQHFYLPAAMLAAALVVPFIAYGLVAGALLLHMSINHKLKVKHRAAFGDAGGLVTSMNQEARNWHRAQLSLNITMWAGYIILMAGLSTHNKDARYGCFIPGILLFSLGWFLTFLVWACTSCVGTKAAKYLSRRAQCSPSTLVAALKRLQAMPVDISATIKCYHMETQTTWINSTDANGNSTSVPVMTQVPVTTFKATDHLKLAACVDQTGDADALSYITECTRVRIVVCCEAADAQSAASYNNLRSRLEQAHARRDVLHSITYATLVNGKAEHCYLVAPTNSCARCMVSQWVYFLFVLVCWNWIYLVWLDSVSHGIVIKLRKRYKVLSDAPSGAPPIAYPSVPPA